MNSSMIDRRQARISRTYSEISRRMRAVGVPIEPHIDETQDWPVRAWDHLLAGIEFDFPTIAVGTAGRVVDGRARLLNALAAAKKGGRAAFRQGKKLDKEHWALDASMAVTPGVGFREIFYFDKEARDRRRGIGMMSMRGPKPDPNFSAQFGGGRARVDLTSLHVAVLDKMCKIHVDQTGFVMEPLPGTGGDVVLSPDFLQHVVYELLARDIGNMPASVEVYVPNSNNNFSRAGIRATANLSKQLKVTVDKSIGFWPSLSSSFTISLSGEFD